MSLLGTLEQFRLPNVLQRLESHAKTGLLVVRQGVRWVEFYVRNGCLLCIGPVRTNATLVDRLWQDKLIAQQVWQEMKHVLGSDEQSETRVAIALMERGCVTRDQLRAWTTEKSLVVLSAVLAWTSGEIYFEEGTQPPSDRLLVSMSITALIETVIVDIPAPQTQPLQTTPVPSGLKFKITQESPSPAVLSSLRTSTVRPTTSPLPFAKPPKAVQPKVDIARIPTLLGTEQFMDEPAVNTTSISNVSLPELESFASFFGGDNDSGVNLSLSNTNEISFASLVSSDGISTTSEIIQPEPVKYPSPPRRIDTSFMQPDMVLVPADLSAFREQNPRVQITPDQWRVLTCVDGHNSLQMACQLLGLTPDAICVLAGELVAEGLIYVVPADQVRIQVPASITQVLSTPDVAHAYVAPGYAAGAVSPWSTSVPAIPATNAVPNPSTALPFETESQWGNGGNGATFVPGRGWITTPQTMQPLYSVGALASPSGIYAPVSSSRC